MKCFAATLFAALLSPALAFADPAGLWTRTNAAGETHIRIEAVNSLYTGTIEWMENPRNDIYNFDPGLRDRPLVGLQIFVDMIETSPTTWEGSLYNPEDGHTYAGTVTEVDATTLELEGCANIILCQSDTWTRVE